MMKIAGEAKKMQEKQEEQARKQLELLHKISQQLDQVINLLKSK